MQAIRASVGYAPPSPHPMNLEAIKAMVAPVLGYDNLSYWNLFCSDDAGALVDKHVRLTVLPPDDDVNLI